MDILYYLGFTSFYYITCNNYLPLLLFGLDNLLISYNVFCHTYQFNYHLSYYDESYYNRYIFYCLLSFVNPLLHILFYTYYNNYIISYILFMTSTPPIFKILLFYITPMIDFIKIKMLKIIKIAKYHLTIYIMKNLCINLLSLDPCFNVKEISLLWKKDHKTNILLFLKNVIILIIIKSITDSNTYTLNIIKSFYNTRAKYQYKDPHPNIYFDIEKIKIIIMKREWEQFFNPYVIETLYKIIDNKPEVSFVEKIKNFEICMGKMLTVLCLSKISLLYNTLNYYILIGIVSLSLTGKLTNINLKTILIRCAGVFISYIYDNFLIGAFICEFYDLLLNHIINWMTFQVYKWIDENYYVITHYNKYNLIISYHILYLSFVNEINYLSLLFIIINSSVSLVSLWFIFFGYFSNYALHHLLVLGLLLYIIINVYYSKSAPRQKLQLSIIQDYVIEDDIKNINEINEITQVINENEININENEINIKNENGINIKNINDKNINIKNINKYENEININDNNINHENIKNINDINYKNINDKSKYKPIHNNSPKYTICHVLNAMHNPKYNKEPV